MDQNAVDALLNTIQEQTEDLSQKVGAETAPASPAAVVGLDHAAASIAEIAGEMETPGIPAAGSPGMLDSANAVDLAGEFSAPGPSATAPKAATGEIHRLLAIEVPLIVQLGRRRLNVAEVMRLAVGAILEFQKNADEEMDLLVNNKAIGKGHAVKVGENFGIKITSIGSVAETIRKLGRA